MRAVIGEDQALLREGLAHVVGSAGFEVVAAEADAEAMLAAVRRDRPDLVVTDIRMPPTYTDEGLRAALEIRQRLPGAAVLVLSQFVQRRYAIELVRSRPAGVGYLLKQRITDVATFRADLHRLCRGGTVLDPEVVTSLLSHAEAGKNSLDRLTPRQRDVLALMAAGRSNASIARALSLTEKAVVQHASHITRAGDPATADRAVASPPRCRSTFLRRCATRPAAPRGRRPPPSQARRRAHHSPPGTCRWTSSSTPGGSRHAAHS